MSEQRQHFLLNYLKTLSVGPAGIEPRPTVPHSGTQPIELTRCESLLINIMQKQISLLHSVNPRSPFTYQAINIVTVGAAVQLKKIGHGE